MRYALLALVLMATPALAQEKPACIDASRSAGYNARPIALHEVLARNANGREQRSVRLATTCIHVDATARVGLHSLTQCLSVGDDVVVTAIDGRREACRVTKLSPGGGYATAEYER
jgi:hypothetical protein